MLRGLAGARPRGCGTPKDPGSPAGACERRGSCHGHAGAPVKNGLPPSQGSKTPFRWTILASDESWTEKAVDGALQEAAGRGALQGRPALDPSVRSGS
jgi:hypothetical protein